MADEFRVRAHVPDANRLYKALEAIEHRAPMPTASCRGWP